MQSLQQEKERGSVAGDRSAGAFRRLVGGCLGLPGVFPGFCVNCHPAYQLQGNWSKTIIVPDLAWKSQTALYHTSATPRSNAKAKEMNPVRQHAREVGPLSLHCFFVLCYLVDFPQMLGHGSGTDKQPKEKVFE